MGCVSSKKQRRRTTRTTTPESSPGNIVQSAASDLDWTLKSNSGSICKIGFSGRLEKIKEEPEKEKDDQGGGGAAAVPQNQEPGHLSKPGPSSERTSSFSVRYGRRFTQGENVAAGWPPWLCNAANEAVDGWLPLKADRFEKLEKIGQGTYSSVCRARDVETGKIVALKKVRFENFKPESVRFMAREITILRRLDHPNIMKLEGIIASKLSCSIYLVFEYMEHDLAGLLSCPDIKFTEAQIKCFMRQLLCGIEHCHSQGVMHRDVKTSNILVNNEGILKMADFGLAKFTVTNNREQLTSRVVTLWYRPPELLLGSTSYGGSVDMWSVGCVFAELFTGRPLLKGKTEVEQLHKIFKLCGTPSDEYWRKSKLPLATMLKPQHQYECVLQERCKDFPRTALKLIETFLSIEPNKRGTAASALNSEYFSSEPYACDPSSLPKYPPNKEMDAKLREDARRKKASRMRATGAGASRNPRRVRKPLEESATLDQKQEAEGNAYASPRSNDDCPRPKGKGVRDIDAMSEASQVSQTTDMSQTKNTRSGQLTPASCGVADRRRKQGSASSRIHAKKPLKAQSPSVVDPNSVLHAGSNPYSNKQGNTENSSRVHAALRHREENSKRAMQRERIHPHRCDSFNWSDTNTPGK